MSYGGLYSGWFAQRPGGHLPRMGGALIQLHPRMEDRYLSLDRYPFIDLGWQKLWLYVPNESPPLPSYSLDRLRGDLLESWEELPPLEDTKGVPYLLDVADSKTWHAEPHPNT